MTPLGISSRHQCKISKVTVKYNTITNSFSVRILVTSNSSALIEGNRVTDSPEVGIIISNSDKKILLLDNTLQRNRSAGIQCSEASPIIRQNLITQNGFGILIDDAQPNLGTVAAPGLNRLYDNKEGDVVNLGKSVVLAQQNYWGRPNGPCQNCIFGKVEYKPFRLSFSRHS